MQEIWGYVIDAETGAPVPGPRIKIFDASGALKSVYGGDDKGVFRFQEDPNTVVELIAGQDYDAIKTTAGDLLFQKYVKVYKAGKTPIAQSLSNAAAVAAPGKPILKYVAIGVGVLVVAFGAYYFLKKKKG